IKKFIASGALDVAPATATSLLYVFHSDLVSCRPPMRHTTLIVFPTPGISAQHSRPPLPPRENSEI
ncbi:hypothetical protein AB4Y33_43465, partial [Paraburkholderia sp. BR14319]|uniref:hypothetical protein n=1 Tax=Paraburkholderia sp. BR14319 TaxID=3237005 RepID=UPI0034D386D7